jgi:hypothetical protein
MRGAFVVKPPFRSSRPTRDSLPRSRAPSERLLSSDRIVPIRRRVFPNWAIAGTVKFLVRADVEYTEGRCSRWVIGSARPGRGRLSASPVIPRWPSRPDLDPDYEPVLQLSRFTPPDGNVPACE